MRSARRGLVAAALIALCCLGAGAGSAVPGLGVPDGAAASPTSLPRRHRRSGHDLRPELQPVRDSTGLHVGWDLRAAHRRHERRRRSSVQVACFRSGVEQGQENADVDRSQWRALDRWRPSDEPRRPLHPHRRQARRGHGPDRPHAAGESRRVDSPRRLAACRDPAQGTRFHLRGLGAGEQPPRRTRARVREGREHLRVVEPESRRNRAFRRRRAIRQPGRTPSGEIRTIG